MSNFNSSGARCGIGSSSCSSESGSSVPVLPHDLGEGLEAELIWDEGTHEIYFHFKFVEDDDVLALAESVAQEWGGSDC